VDVLKGVKMYEQLRVPTLAVVENLAYLTLPGPGGGPGGAVAHPFGKPGRHLAALAAALPSHRGRLADLNRELPVCPALAAAAEHGRPLTAPRGLGDNGGGGGDPDNAAAARDAVAALESLATLVASRCYEEAFASLAHAPIARWDPRRNGLSVRWCPAGDGSAMAEVLLPPRLVRAADPATGSPLPSPEEGAGAGGGAGAAATATATAAAAGAGGGDGRGSGCGGGGGGGSGLDLAAAKARAVAMGGHGQGCGHDHDHSHHHGAQAPMEVSVSRATKAADQGGGAALGVGSEAVPVSVEPRGNYAVRIRWSDGFEQPFFAYDALVALAVRHMPLSAPRAK